MSRRDASRVSTRSAQRFAARARSRRWGSARPAVVTLVVAVLIGALVWTVLGSGALDVRRVQLSGTTGLSAARVRAVAATVVGDPMVTVDTDGLRSRLAEIPAVATVDVSLSWPATVRVHIVERRAVLAVHHHHMWQLVDATGVAFATTSQRPNTLLSLKVDRPAPDDPATRAALAVLHALPHRVRKSVVAIAAPTPAGVRLKLRHGATVVWGGPEDATHKAAALAALLHRKAQVYDVSTPGIVTTS